MNSISNLFKALADETRLRIINLLSQGELCVCDLTHALKMPQSTVSRHLSTLKTAGLVTDRRCKTWAYYRLTDSAQPMARDVLASLAAHMADMQQPLADLDALGAFRCNPERNCEQPPKRRGRS